MSDLEPGGRSSPTPDSSVRLGLGSQSSPLQRLKVRRPERKIPAHFTPIDSGFRSVIIYLTVCVQRKKTVTRESYRKEADRGSMASKHFLVHWSLCDDHIHLFCAPNTFPAQSLKKWIACWKNRVTREWTNRSQISIWQREFWAASCTAPNRTKRNGTM